MTSRYSELRRTNGLRLRSVGEFGAHQQILTGFASCHRYCNDVAHRRPTLHDVWPSPGLVHYIYIFWGSCPLTEFCPVHSLYVQVLCSLILAALLHGTPAAVVSQTLRLGTRNGITELSQRTPPIFGWAAITLGIVPQSSLLNIDAD